MLDGLYKSGETGTAVWLSVRQYEPVCPHNKEQ